MTDKSQILTQIFLILLKSTNLSSFPNHFHFLFISSLENVVLYHVNLIQWPSRNRKNAAFFLFIGMFDFGFKKFPIIFIKSHSCPESRKIWEFLDSRIMSKVTVGWNQVILSVIWIGQNLEFKVTEMNLSILGSMRDENVNNKFKKDKALNTFKVLTINKTYIMVPSGESLA